VLQVPLAQSKSLSKIGDRYIQLQSDKMIKEDNLSKMALNPKFEQFLGSPTDLIIHSSRIQITGLERETSPKLFTPEKND
jgi:hypothetical protein